MKKPTFKRTLEELFEYTHDATTEPYEVVRTIGFTLKCKSGTKEFRLEDVKHPGKELSSVLVWERQENGAWRHGSVGRYPTLDRAHPDLALRAMVMYIEEHLPQS